MNIWGFATHMNVTPQPNLVRRFKNVNINQRRILGKCITVVYYGSRGSI